jgi:hypothetical protein
MSMTLPEGLLAAHPNEVFVETGTYDGACVQAALAAGFPEIHSVEVDPGRHRACAARFAGNPRVTIHLGDTLDVLPRILSALDRRATIWLDAHPLHPGERLTDGRVRWPLLEELRAVAGSSLRRDHTILIDDSVEFGPLFGTTEDEVMSLLREINPRYRMAFVDSKIRPLDILVASVPSDPERPETPSERPPASVPSPPPMPTGPAIIGAPHVVLGVGPPR